MVLDIGFICPVGLKFKQKAFGLSLPFHITTTPVGISVQSSCCCCSILQGPQLGKIWQHPKDLCKHNLDQISTWRSEVSTKLNLQLRTFGGGWIWGDGRSLFFKGIIQDEWTTLRWNAKHSRSVGQENWTWMEGK